MVLHIRIYTRLHCPACDVWCDITFKRTWANASCTHIHTHLSTKQFRTGQTVSISSDCVKNNSTAVNVRTHSLCCIDTQNEIDVTEIWLEFKWCFSSILPAATKKKKREEEKITYWKCNINNLCVCTSKNDI